MRARRVLDVYLVHALCRKTIIRTNKETLSFIFDILLLSKGLYTKELSFMLEWIGGRTNVAGLNNLGLLHPSFAWVGPFLRVVK